MTRYESVVEPTPTGFEDRVRCTGCREQARRATAVEHDADCPLTGGREIRTDGGEQAGDGTVRTFGYNCFGKGCSEEFDSLEEMEYIDGKDGRDGRHFCPECADDILTDRSVDADSNWPEGDR